MTSEPFLWYRDKDRLRIGEVNRYIVTYKRQRDANTTQIYFRIKNIENSGIRTIHLLTGPFILYCHVVPCNYNYKKKFCPDNVEQNPEVAFENQIKPNQSFNVTLLLNENSLSKTSTKDGIDWEHFQWEIEVISQIVITKKTEVLYDMMIGDDLHAMKRLGQGKLQKTLTSIVPNNSDEDRTAQEVFDHETTNHVFNPFLSVQKKTTNDLWSKAPPEPLQPVHLVIVTHGIFSNLTSDMLYLKETLESSVSENIMIRGYRYNAGKTEKGIKKLGRNVGDYIVDVVEKEPYNFNKISFIAHSLGGVVQLYAIKYILVTRGVDFFDRLHVKPINLISLASPFLGILNELNLVLSWILDLGTLGKTGRDLTLSKRLPGWRDVEIGDHRTKDRFKPVLETLPDEPLQTFLAKFERLTVYANAINDGIVPLRTAAILYLDYEALGDVNELKKTNNVIDRPELEADHHDVESNESQDDVSEIPQSDGAQTKAIEKKPQGIEVKNGQTSHALSKEKNRLKEVHDKFDEFTNLNSSQKKLTRRQKKYQNFSIKGSDTNSDSLSASVDSSMESSSSTTATTVNVPPRASAIESALNTLICPIPSQEYIMDPASRNHVIFHDKYYHFDKSKDETNVKSRSLKERLFGYSADWRLHKQVVIANKYHTKQLSWRKVLVNLPPDAHNNIIVRRRFANGYGWGVIHHLCENLFETKTDDNGGSETNIKPYEETLLDSTSKDKHEDVQGSGSVKAKI
ncbi:hypothetical protein FOB58_003190 [Candida parapsilosis]|uniref:DUF676 domain-containing protein n=2 Tax=Candida parapsilosis TaxID=5480 RepID=G8B6R0_CANPC|nr:uncharacterized protein CPAR2_101800 [Candida parapsilosis]KAF6048121.1 hypothetical protein FOB59_003163 [Candida parapsilosis]KAF6049913.1 hypothetical protein FOB58_003190 [Candida parapsilosis]KAF6057776.1 hypothetical protein FOB60_002331 [Candida parapsilosis]KAF6065517.1 hypothetical protein FOB61_001587 [Candida parapsilosis]KAI5906001.1 putative lipase [Candida parapsilosis]